MDGNSDFSGVCTSSTWHVAPSSTTGSLGPTGNVGSPGCPGPSSSDAIPWDGTGHRGPVGPIGGAEPPGGTQWETFEYDSSSIKIKEERMNRRFVRVLIVDPDERIRAEDALLYVGKSHLTDMTDEEIFLALDLGTLLAKHNAVRETILDEEETRKRGKDVYLPPIKIRDLAKRVVVIATF